LDSAVGYGFDEGVVVALVLVGVTGGELGDGVIEGVIVAEVFGNRDRVAGSGVGGGKPLLRLAIVKLAAIRLSWPRER
jgi:hypothetical protein